MDLESLVKKYQTTKDESLFNKIYNETIKMVKFALYTYTNDKYTIEDLSQDVYMKISANIDKYNGGNFLNYIYQISKRTGIDYVRKTHELTNLDDNFIPSDAKNPYLNYALSHLDNNLREIFLMKVLLGYTSKKISIVLNISIKVVNSSYYKAKKQLKMELEDVKNEI